MNDRRRTPQPREFSPREPGLALFVVMVVVVVLSVLVFQLTYTTKVEERISKNRNGLLELDLALTAVGRSVIIKIEQDWQDDQDAAEEEDTAAPNEQAGDGDQGAAAGDPAGAMDPAQIPTGEETTEVGTDSRHEVWAPPFSESINDIEVEGLITDGESGFNLNLLFKYPRLEEDEEEEEGAGEGDGEGEGAEEGQSGDGSGDGEEGDEESDDEVDPDDPEELDLNSPPEIEIEPPTPEQVEAAREMVTRLIEGIIAYNQEMGFDYQEDTPNSDLAAQAIVEWVMLRQEVEEDPFIRRIDPLKNLDEVTWELYNGPPLPEELLEQQQLEGLDGLADELPPLAGFAEYLETGMMGIEGYYEIDGGVEAEPRPLGLKHVFNAHPVSPDAEARINLNTARPEVLAAVLTSFDLDEAIEIAVEIETHLNSFVEEEEDDQAGTPAGEEAPDPDEEASQDFNVFESFDDVGQVNEEWTEEQVGQDEDETIYALVQKDLERIATFRSTHFTVHLKGKREDQEVEGVLVLKRAEGKIRVLSWRELDR